MDIKLSRKHAAFVRARTASGKNPDEQDVIREALDALAINEKAEAKRLAWLRAEIQKGIDDVAAGRVVNLDIEEIMAEVDREDAAATRKKVA